MTAMIALLEAAFSEVQRSPSLKTGVQYGSSLQASCICVPNSPRGMITTRSVPLLNRMPGPGPRKGWLHTRYATRLISTRISAQSSVQKPSSPPGHATFLPSVNQRPIG